MPYGLGEGSVARDAAFAASAEPFPLVVLSPGAGGSAPNYGWLAESLCRQGIVVLGVSHYGESWLYGASTIDPLAATRLWLRPFDCSFALDRFLEEDSAGAVDRETIAAIGHSSGGATAVALGGAPFDPVALREYCASEAARLDRGCQYSRGGEGARPIPDEATRSYGDRRITALVLMDPAAGPGYTGPALAGVGLPALVIGSVENDFLPYEHHAERYARLLPRAELLPLSSGEGHFVYVNRCSAELAAQGVPLCVDRPGVDRDEVHAFLAARILDFLRTARAQCAVHDFETGSTATPGAGVNEEASYLLHATEWEFDAEVPRVAFSSDDGRYLLLQRSEEEVAGPLPDLANVYIERDDQGWGGYGGLSKVWLTEDSLSILLGPRMAAQLGDQDRLRVTFKLSTSEGRQLREALGAVLEDYDDVLEIMP